MLEQFHKVDAVKRGMYSKEFSFLLMRCGEIFSFAMTPQADPSRK